MQSEDVAIACDACLPIVALAKMVSMSDTINDNPANPVAESAGLSLVEATVLLDKPDPALGFAFSFSRWRRTVRR